MLQSVGLQSVGRDLATEQQRQTHESKKSIPWNSTAVLVVDGT